MTELLEEKRHDEPFVAVDPEALIAGRRPTAPCHGRLASSHS